MLLEGLCVNRGPAKAAATVGVGDARLRRRSAAGFRRALPDLRRIVLADQRLCRRRGDPAAAGLSRTQRPRSGTSRKQLPQRPRRARLQRRVGLITVGELQIPVGEVDPTEEHADRLVKQVNHLRRLIDRKDAEVPPALPSQELVLLGEIRDLLLKQTGG